MSEILSSNTVISKNDATRATFAATGFLGVAIAASLSIWLLFGADVQESLVKVKTAETEYELVRSTVAFPDKPERYLHLDRNRILLQAEPA